jgi:hypothetical protein
MIKRMVRCPSHQVARSHLGHGRIESGGSAESADRETADVSGGGEAGEGVE